MPIPTAHLHLLDVPLSEGAELKLWPVKLNPSIPGEKVYRGVTTDGFSSPLVQNQSRSIFSQVFWFHTKQVLEFQGVQRL